MQCPRCQIELAAHIVDDVEIDECTSCGGVWFDHDELRRAKDLMDPNLGWLDFEIWEHEDRFKVGAGRLACPRCGDATCTLAYDATEIDVDYCPACRGAWLDKRELEHIVLALENELAGMSARELVASSLKEALEVLTGPESRASEWADLKHVLRLLTLRLAVENPGLHRLMVQAAQSTPLT